MLYKSLYTEIGRLLYAVADVDGVISQKEKQRLHEIVEKELVPAETAVDAHGSNEAWHVEFEFDWREEQISDPSEAFTSFIEFVQDHSAAFDRKMKALCIRLAKEIAAAYYGSSRKEKALINLLIAKLNAIKAG